MSKYEKNWYWDKKIDKIILACNRLLQANEMEELIQKCDSIECEIITVSSLSYEINGKFPTIAQDFLSIDVITIENEFDSVLCRKALELSTSIERSIEDEILSSIVNRGVKIGSFS